MKNPVVPRVSRGQIEIVNLAYELSCQGVGLGASVILFLDTVQDVCNEVCVPACVCLCERWKAKETRKRN